MEKKKRRKTDEYCAEEEHCVTFSQAISPPPHQILSFARAVTCRGRQRPQASESGFRSLRHAEGIQPWNSLLLGLSSDSESLSVPRLKFTHGAVKRAVLVVVAGTTGPLATQ